MEKTIATISTPLGKGAISIVRISGKEALNIAFKIFYSKNLIKDNITPRMLYLGHIKTKDFQEKCLMVFFKAPNSYTGEDLVEFQIHGGEFLTQKIYQTILENGAIPAEPGEFSKQAFLNGKISLDEAEGIISIINADSESELKASYRLAGGELNKKIIAMQNELTEVLAKINVDMDYPEYDDEEALLFSIKPILENDKNIIYSLIESYKNSKYIKSGVNISLVGRPNVGKSSLLNAILKEDRAIVTDIAGTTRDVLTESIYYNGIKFNFTDTAGIRESDDIVEKIGVEKSKKAIEESDIVLLILDSTKVLSKEEKELLEFIKKYNHIIVLNKIDETKKIDFTDAVEISAKNEIGIENLLKKIYYQVITSDLNYSSIIITNSRHAKILEECNEIIDEILSITDPSLDILEFKIKKLWNALGKITGQTENENIIDLIFSKFCLGK